LVYGVKERKGFVVLSGGVGTGKTTLIRALLDRLDKNFQVAYIFNPKLSVPSFFKYVCQDFGFQVKGRSKVDYLTQLHDFLIASFNSGKTCTLIVDEAQNLDAPLFEEIRMLTNLETTDQKLLQVFLVGQPELDDLLEHEERSQLKQRISVRYHLLALDRKETKEYIQTRMSIAGAENLNCFTEESIQRIYEHSGGIPRLINNICDNALLIGYATDVKTIDVKIIQECAADLKLTTATKRGIHGRIADGIRSYSGIYRQILDGIRSYSGSHRQIVDGIRRHSFVYMALAVILGALVIAGIVLLVSSKSTVPRTRAEPQLGSRETSLVTDKIETGGSREDIGEEFETPDAPEIMDVTEINVTERNVTERDVTEGDVTGREEFVTVFAEEGDTVGQILLRELGRTDVGLLETVRELNPEIEDIDRIAVGQEIRIPLENEGSTREP